MITESYPAGLVANRAYDNNGNLTGLSYLEGSTYVAAFSQTNNAFGEVESQASLESFQLFAYDAAGRLGSVVDVGDGTCTIRGYAFDADSNRTALASYPADGSGNCSPSTTPTVTTWAHDAADRTTNTGYTYDPMGRATAIPAPDTSVGGSGTVTLSYFADDMVHSENDGTNTDTFALDPASRLLSMTDSSTGATTTKVYAGPSDSPAWLSSSTGSWSRNVTDIAGNLAAIQTGTAAGQAALQIVNPHGDVVATLTDATSGATAVTAYFESTEFGAPRAANTVKPAHYGWFGGKRRDSGDITGLVLMGARLYDPYTGRFTSVDPVPGGSANDYDYCDQDPINGLDLTGTNNLAAGGTAYSPPNHHHRGFFSGIKHFVTHTTVHAARAASTKLGHVLAKGGKAIGHAAAASARAVAHAVANHAGEIGIGAALGIFEVTCTGGSFGLGGGGCAALTLAFAGAYFDSTHPNASSDERAREAGRSGLDEILYRVIGLFFD
jgi:RHS repeat-associated protein